MLTSLDEHLWVNLLMQSRSGVTKLFGYFKFSPVGVV